MIPLDYFIFSVVGLIVPLLFYKKFEKLEVFFNRFFLIFLGLLLVVISLFANFLEKWPDWMLAYHFKNPPPSYLVGLWFYAVSIFYASISFNFSHFMVKKKWKKYLLLFILLGILVTAGIWGGLWQEYTHIGTYEQFQSGKILKQSEDKDFLWAFNQTGIMLGLVLFILVVLYLWLPMPREREEKEISKTKEPEKII